MVVNIATPLHEHEDTTVKTILTIAALAAALPAAAQGAHQGHEAPPAMMTATNTAADPYAESMAKMHERMMTAKGVDASETWIRQMLEHHRGAIDMSRIALAKARDRDVRTMATKIIRDQEREVAQMQSWLKRHGKRPQ